MEECPEEFGSLFQTIEIDEDSLLSFITNFDHAVVKFGLIKVFELLEKSIKSTYAFCKKSNLYPFIIVASQKNSALCAINHFLRSDRS